MSTHAHGAQAEPPPRSERRRTSNHTQLSPRTAASPRRLLPLGSLLALLALVGLTALGTNLASAQSEVEEPPADAEAQTEVDEALDDTLILGAEVYTATCSACHQPGGAGIEGQFPPLIDNPHIEDTAYMETVITEGREGEIVVNGVTYNGRMPAFSTISDEDLNAVIVYVQSGFAAPNRPPATDGTVVADGSLPTSVNDLKWIVYIVGIGVAILVLSDRIFGAHDRLTLPWLDAWLKTAVIVTWFVLFTVFVPSWVLQSGPVNELSAVAQDLLGVGVWALGLVGGLAGLYFAHHESRI